MGLTRTERDFQSALLKLLATRSFLSLTVEQICDEAMMHRSSFYRYFNDKYDLLKHTVNSIITNLIDESDDSDQEIANVVTWLSDNKRILRNLASGKSNSSLYAILVNILADIILTRYEQSVYDRIVNAVSLFSNHETGAYMLSSSIVGAFYWWRSQDYAVDKETILAHASQFVEWLDHKELIGGDRIE